MKAMVLRAWGSPQVLRLEDVPEPEVGEHDVLVEVRAAAVNPVDCKIRQGGMGQQRAFPVILGFDVSGVVRQVGPRVQGLKEGDEVYASPSLIRQGANAQYVAVDARTVAPKPGNLSHTQAAVLPLVTITAWEALHRRAGIHPGETVLIHAGGGGVGHIAIQLAKLHGCRVLTTASQPGSIELCRKLGADVVINYAQEDVVRRVMEETNNQGCSVVLDAVGGEVFVQSLDCVAVHGRLVTILPPPPDAPIAKLFLKDATIAQEFMGAPAMFNTHPEAQGQILQTVAELVEARKLMPHVSHVFPLEELPKAHQQQETRHTVGKIAIEVSQG
ncbi:MAG TPA: zinc-binding dehydrogenase [Phycisphaeraceae bacterium]